MTARGPNKANHRAGDPVSSADNEHAMCDPRLVPDSNQPTAKRHFQDMWGETEHRLDIRSYLEIIVNFIGYFGYFIKGSYL